MVRSVLLGSDLLFSLVNVHRNDFVLALQKSQGSRLPFNRVFFMRFSNASRHQNLLGAFFDSATVILKFF